MANTPNIRFKGFTDDWEQHELCDIYGKIRNAFVGTASPYYVENGHFYLESNNVKDGHINHNNEVFINDEFYEKQRDNWLHTGDIVMVQSGHVGHSAVIPEELNNTAAHALIIISNPQTEIDPYFLNAEFQTPLKKKNIDIITKGNTIKHILASDMKEFEVSLPNIREQRDISAFFRILDKILIIHQRRLEDLKNFKKVMLQKMFPSDGESIPEIRFFGFSDAWEQRKVSDICSISTGKSNTQDKVNDGAYPFYVRSPIVERSNKYLYDEEAVLTVGDGVGTGKVFHYVNGKYDLHQRVYRMFGFSNEVSAKYFYYWFSDHFYKRVMAMTAKTSVDSVRYEMIADMELQMPSKPEQEKIANFFTDLDKIITLHQHKYENLLKMKKYLLQQMFC